ncbi:hypothetical protein Sango_2830200 [Sesamum angolense]|uniref:Uncharacterized protein n=1 Tax=Sesamum angolense TaxID=2727404 RepID=A0AAE1T762_9LAMI|nr:hypothetical protein Sango_2830200 [Sesamum angolense]
MESSAENDLCLLAKGKEKALSDGDIYGRSSHDDDDNHESVENFTCNEIYDSANQNTGFKSIFQSLYSRNTNMSDAGMENVDDSIEKPEEVVVADKTSLENLPRSRDGSTCALHASETDLLGDKVSDVLKNATRSLNANVCSTTCPKANHDSWENDVFPIDQKNFEAKDVSPDCKKLGSNGIRVCKVVGCPQAHTFENNKCCNLQSNIFFCGSAHELRECPQVTEAELEDLLAKSNSVESHFTACRLQLHDGNENRSSYHKGDENQKLVVADRTAACSKKLLLGSFPNNSTLDMKKCSNKRDSASNEIQRSNVSNFANNVTDNNNFLPCNFTVQSTTVVHSKIFHAMDGFRYLFVTFEWFFPALAAWQVRSRITGSWLLRCLHNRDAREHNNCQSKKSILVDVGGIKSFVGSQYVLNHDFLKDEIKAWWCKIVKSGCKLPSLDKLNSKSLDF